jgi:hypothetical protein
MARTRRQNNDFAQNLMRNVAAAAILAILGAAVKTWLDVQELKARFEYVNGSGWTVPKR